MSDVPKFSFILLSPAHNLIVMRWLLSSGYHLPVGSPLTSPHSFWLLIPPHCPLAVVSSFTVVPTASVLRGSLLICHCFLNVFRHLSHLF